MVKQILSLQETVNQVSNEKFNPQEELRVIKEISKMKEDIDMIIEKRDNDIKEVLKGLLHFFLNG